MINEVAAEDTHLKEEDVDKLLDAMWNGTKNLITRSKFGQTPRLLLQIEYSEDYYFIGDLNNKISITHELDNDKEIRKIADVKIDVKNLLDNLEKSKDKINKIYYKIDENVSFDDNDNSSLVDKIKSYGIDVEELSL